MSSATITFLKSCDPEITTTRYEELEAPKNHLQKKNTLHPLAWLTAHGSGPGSSNLYAKVLYTCHPSVSTLIKLNHIFTAEHHKLGPIQSAMYDLHV